MNMNQIFAKQNSNLPNVKYTVVGLLTNWSLVFSFPCYPHFDPSCRMFLYTHSISL